MNDPRVMRPPTAGGWAATPRGPTTSIMRVRTLVTDERDGYYAEFGHVADLAKALHRPHIHDGVYSIVPPAALRSAGRRRPAGAVHRLLPGPRPGRQPRVRRPDAARRARPLAALSTLLSPFMPMLFMGEEYGEPAPFQFFSDHIDKEIADATRDGRRQEFAAFASFTGGDPRPAGGGDVPAVEAHPRA